MYIIYYTLNITLIDKLLNYHRLNYTQFWVIKWGWIFWSIGCLIDFIGNLGNIFDYRYTIKPNSHLTEYIICSS